MNSIRQYIKALISYILLIIISPIILSSKIEEHISNSEELFYTFANLLSLIPGKIGKYIRASYYYGTLISCPLDTDIGFCTFFSHRHASVGANVHIGAYCIIGQAMIGDNVMLASRVSVLSGSNPHQAPDGTVTSAVFNPETVKIGRETWIGEGAIVMKDVAEECTIAAGAVVTKPMPANHTAIGNPARFMRKP